MVAKKMKKTLSRKDIVLMIIIIIVAAAAFLLHNVLKDSSAGTAVIKVNGKIEGTYPLNEDQEIKINDGSNILRIRNGKAKMIEADCPDQLCVHQKAVSASGESIICLPNRVIVEVESKVNSELDGMTN